jgi:hypothetical protein
MNELDPDMILNKLMTISRILLPTDEISTKALIYPDVVSIVEAIPGVLSRLPVSRVASQDSHGRGYSWHIYIIIYRYMMLCQVNG